MTDAYIEHKYGHKAMNIRLMAEREQVVAFARQRYWPVIKNDVGDLMLLLNANSYQKGAWILHMLRNQVGDAAFWTGLREYHARYTHANASSDDFRHVMEEASGMQLKKFFRQWLERPGHPVIRISLEDEPGTQEILIEQVQQQRFRFPLEFEIRFTDGTSDIITVEMRSRRLAWKNMTGREIESVAVDPRVVLLHEISPGSGL
jgi:aminopeptidase N